MINSEEARNISRKWFKIAFPFHLLQYYLGDIASVVKSVYKTNCLLYFSSQRVLKLISIVKALRVCVSSDIYKLICIVSIQIYSFAE